MTVDPYAWHGIDHLSPSSLNLWAAEPAMWIMERLMHARAPVGCAAHRGTAAEAGIAKGLLDPQLDPGACIDHALAEYDMMAALSGDPGRDKERDAIPGIIRQALPELRRYGVPDGLQGHVSHRFEGIPVPIMGYFDFRWSAHGIVVDLKTQLRLAGEIKPAHGRQVSLYIHNTADEGRVCYTTPQKLAMYKLTDPAAHLDALLNVARRLTKFLAISADKAELASMIAPNYESFYWNPVARQLGREVFGF